MKSFIQTDFCSRTEYDAWVASGAGAGAAATYCDTTMGLESQTWPDQVTGRGVWTGQTLAAESIRVTLTAEQVMELLVQGAAMREAGARIHSAEVTTARFPLKTFVGTAAWMREELSDGRGILILSNFPVNGQTDDDVERMYFLLCEHVGVCVTQNCGATLVHHVTLGW